MGKITINEEELKEKLALSEKLGRIEELLDHLVNSQACQDKKIDRILGNDSKKLQRIAKLEERVGNIKIALYLFLIPIIGSLVKMFI